VSDPVLPSGTQLGKFRIVRLIGSGGMGAVYEATHLELRKRVAIKTLLPTLAAMPEARARFLREGEAASRIEHPNVVNVTDIGTAGEVPFLVMEYLDGESLAQRLDREGALAIPVVLDLLLPIMDALARGHDEGVVHRDLKPQNIFLARGGDGRLVPKLLDYGVSKIVGDDRLAALTGSLAVLGTAQYMAPEQIDGPKNVDARTDQYAMALVMFECVTGRAARQGTSMMAMLKSIATEPAPSLRQARPDVDRGFDAVVSRALSFEPAARFPSMRHLMFALLPFARAQTGSHWHESLAGRVDSSMQVPVMAPTVMLSDSSPLAVPTSALPGPSTTFRTHSGEVATVPTRPRGRWALGLVAVGLLGVGAFAVVQVLTDGPPHRRSHPSAPPQSDDEPTPTPAPTPRPRPQPERHRVEIRATPAEATIRLDGFSLGQSPVVTEVSAGAHEVVVSAPGYRPVTLEFSEQSPLPPVIELVSEARPAPDRPRPPRPIRERPQRRHPVEGNTPARGANDSVIID